MYTLIYDEHDLEKPYKKVLSVHKNREAAEIALQKRMQKLGRRVWDCHTRIVWTESNVKPGELLAPNKFSTWRPGETVPVGELYSDTD
jgi:hypothetical protein